MTGEVDHVLRRGQQELEAELVQGLDARAGEFLRGEHEGLVHHDGAVGGEALLGDAQLVAQRRGHDERGEALPLAAGHGPGVRVHEDLGLLRGLPFPLGTCRL